MLHVVTTSILINHDLLGSLKTKGLTANNNYQKTVRIAIRIVVLATIITRSTASVPTSPSVPDCQVFFPALASRQYSSTAFKRLGFGEVKQDWFKVYELPGRGTPTRTYPSMDLYDFGSARRDYHPRPLYFGAKSQSLSD